MRDRQGYTVRELASAPEPPGTRGECELMPRPCPALRCRYHLPAVACDGASCALDEADRGGMTLNDVAVRLGVTRERVRQIEANGLRRLQKVKGRL